MKHILFLLLLFQVFSIKSNAQCDDKNDSMLTYYVNYLAAHTNLSYDSIHHLEVDSAAKIVHDYWKLNGPNGLGFVTDSSMGHFDDATLAFILKRRLKIPAKK